MLRNELKNRWENGDSYNEYIADELSSFRKEAWQEQLSSALPKNQNLKILDVGTGPGFFAIILSELGHEVTAIDQSEGMLHYAKKNAKEAGLDVEFYSMSAESLEFIDHKFDAIVMRNVTWTLPNPKQAYTEFKRVLKPGGTLLVYDANWHLHFYDDAKMQRVRAREQAYFEKYGRKEVVCNDDRTYYDALPLSNTKRPEWDIQCLQNLGFELDVTQDISNEVYTQWERDLYAEIPLFQIKANSKPMDKTLAKIHEYWQKRSSSFGFDVDLKTVDFISKHVSDLIPTGNMCVLDVGTGTGTIAAIMAMLDHQVTGVDFCSNMIALAKENAKAHELDIQFMVCDANGLPFEDDTFDVVISRNVVWALQTPETVLSEWKRVLKPGGTLIYFDGNHYYYLFNEQALNDREKYIELSGRAHKGNVEGVNFIEMETLAQSLPLSSKLRPSQWDVDALAALGMEEITTREWHPQFSLNQGKAEGYYSRFVVAAKKSHV